MTSLRQIEANRRNAARSTSKMIAQSFRQWLLPLSFKREGKPETRREALKLLFVRPCSVHGAIATQVDPRATKICATIPSATNIWATTNVCRIRISNSIITGTVITGTVIAGPIMRRHHSQHRNSRHRNNRVDMPSINACNAKRRKRTPYSGIRQCQGILTCSVSCDQCSEKGAAHNNAAPTILPTAFNVFHGLLPMQKLRNSDRVSQLYH